MSQIITFYSYKGGVGRSMALANVATLLSKWGKKVLMIDWDLEAPGLEFFFKPYLPEIDWSQQKGVLDWLYAVQNQEDAKWRDWVISFKTKISKTDLHLLVAGKSNGNYSEMLRQFSVSKFYDEHRGGHVIEQFREELLANYDYILIDSRTGVTDFGGICTIQMPDILVMLFSATEQGLTGTLKIAQRAESAHQNLPFDRYKLLICPVPSRISSTTEYETSRSWLSRIGETLKNYYEDWVPASVDIKEFMQLIKIPNIDYFSFGESLPVIEQGVIDPAGLGYAYENLAMLVGRGLDEVDEFVEKRELYLEEISGEKPNQTRPNITLADSIRCVRIFISSADKDLSLKNKLINIINKGVSNKNIEFIYRKPVPLGQSRVNFLLNNIGRSDIVLLLLTSNYFISSSDVISGYLIDSDVHTEFDIIENIDSDKQLVIPIYLNSDYKSNMHLNTLSVRQGIIANDLSAYDPIEYCAKELLPIIEQKLREKGKLNLVV